MGFSRRWESDSASRIFSLASRPRCRCERPTATSIDNRREITLLLSDLGDTFTSYFAVNRTHARRHSDGCRVSIREEHFTVATFFYRREVDVPQIRPCITRAGDERFFLFLFHLTVLRFESTAFCRAIKYPGVRKTIMFAISLSYR